MLIEARDWQIIQIDASPRNTVLAMMSVKKAIEGSEVIDSNL
jgi:hypothetical protein